MKVKVNKPRVEKQEKVRTDKSTAEKQEIPNKEKVNINEKNDKQVKKCVCVTGNNHRKENLPNQDYALRVPGAKIVLDGCGSCKHSQIGVKLFALSFERIANKIKITPENFEQIVKKIFKRMLEIFDDDYLMNENYAFTILACIETETSNVVLACGDGYIITETLDGKIEFEKIDNGEYPKYYIYNYIKDKSQMEAYREGVQFDRYDFPKDKYKKVGVSTDGLRNKAYLLDNELEIMNECLRKENNIALEEFCEKNISIFDDDISISF